jgi:hypothetical protein
MYTVLRGAKQLKKDPRLKGINVRIGDLRDSSRIVGKIVGTGLV